jgi:hypothetical protein
MRWSRVRAPPGSPKLCTFNDLLASCLDVGHRTFVRNVLWRESRGVDVAKSAKSGLPDTVLKNLGQNNCAHEISPGLLNIETNVIGPAFVPKTLLAQLRSGPIEARKEECTGHRRARICSCGRRQPRFGRDPT